MAAAPGGNGDGKPIQRASARTIPTVDVLPARTGPVVERVEAVGTTRANESVMITAKQTGNVADDQIRARASGSAPARC